MNKRKVEVFVKPAEGEDDATVGYEIWELTGFRVYTNVGSDNDLAISALGNAVTSDLLALDL